MYVITTYLHYVECLCSDWVREISTRWTDGPHNAATSLATRVAYAHHVAGSLVERGQASTQVGREAIL